MPRKKDVMNPSPEEIQRELTTEKNGFDILLEQKEANIDTLDAYLLNNPGATRKQISEATGMSIRSISRYMTILKARYSKDQIKNNSEVQLEQKKVRVDKLKGLLKKDPTTPRKNLAKNVGVSLRTLKGYLKELK